MAPLSEGTVAGHVFVSQDRCPHHGGPAAHNQGCSRVHAVRSTGALVYSGIMRRVGG